MFHSLQSQIALIALLAACAFAFMKGGPAERGGAVLIALSWFSEYAVALIFKHVFSPGAQEMILLATDGALAIGLLALAFRFTKMWLGVAMLMMSGELALHGAVMGDWGLPFLQYLILNNLLSIGLVLLLTGATVTAWVQKRRRNKPVAAERGAPSMSVPPSGHHVF